MTKTAVAAQDEERKAFMGSIRDCLAAKVRSGQEWQEVIARHTHPGSIWHFTDRDVCHSIMPSFNLAPYGNTEIAYAPLLYLHGCQIIGFPNLLDYPFIMQH